MLDGDEWKDDGKPVATAVNMRKFKEYHTRLLLSITGYEGLVETSVQLVSPCGEYCKVGMGWGGGTWVRIQDVRIMSILFTPAIKLPQDGATLKFLEPKVDGATDILTSAMLEQIWKDMNDQGEINDNGDESNDVG